MAGACNNLAELHRLKKEFPEAEALYKEVHKQTKETNKHSRSTVSPVTVCCTNPTYISNTSLVVWRHTGVCKHL